MRGELKPTTPQGERFVALAEDHAADFATRAEQHDRESSFPFENYDAMKKSLFLAGPVPEDLGGFGVTSVHDLGVGLARIARADASTAIATNMHIISIWTVSRMLGAIRAGGGRSKAGPGLEGLLRGVVSGDIIAAATGTEAGTNIRHPNAEVKPDGDGYVLNGHKIFGTLSPVATVFFVPARMTGGSGEPESVLCTVFRRSPGVEIRDNWDALGMRGSGSGDVVYDNVKLSAGAVIRSRRPLGASAFAGGEPGVANFGLISSFLGIAEAAAEIATDLVKKRRKGPSATTMAERSYIQQHVGAMEVDLAVCRNMVGFMGRRLDEITSAYPRRDIPEHLALEMEHLHDTTKHIVNRAAIDVVDKALTASGGAGYMTKSPLSRLYRDVRAGPFMQPYSPLETLEVVGRRALDQPQNPDL